VESRPEVGSRAEEYGMRFDVFRYSNRAFAISIVKRHHCRELPRL
jgi:hypothetical protein